VKLSRTFNSPLVFDSGFCRDSYYTAESQVELVAPVLRETGSLSETAKCLGLSPSMVRRYSKALDGSKTERRARYIALRVREIGSVSETAYQMKISRSTVMRYVKMAQKRK
jgi:predicted transcriptional regulator